MRMRGKSWKFCVTLVLLMTLSCQQPKTEGRADVRGAHSVGELLSLLNMVALWGDPLEYRDAAWRRMFHVADVIQRTDPNLVCEALDAFMDQPLKDNEPTFDDINVFLLIRVVFDLPEDAPKEDLVYSIGCDEWEDAIEGDRANLSWPISWKSGKPELDSYPMIILGPPYDPSAEYMRLRKRYPLRDLSKYAFPTAEPLCPDVTKQYQRHMWLAPWPDPTVIVTIQRLDPEIIEIGLSIDRQTPESAKPTRVRVYPVNCRHETIEELSMVRPESTGYFGGTYNAALKPGEPIQAEAWFGSEHAVSPVYRP